MTFRFENGGDLTVRVNGAVLGGVSELRRQVKRKTEGIFEFLTDKPVAVTAGETYYITMKLRRGADYPFDGAVESVAVSGGGRRELYTLCTVEKAESEALPHGEVGYTVSIAAQERSVSDE